VGFRRLEGGREGGRGGGREGGRIDRGRTYLAAGRVEWRGRGEGCGEQLETGVVVEEGGGEEGGGEGLCIRGRVGGVGAIRVRLQI